jgi:hypothetical protein
MVSIGGLVTRIRVAPQRQPPSQGRFQSAIHSSLIGRFMIHRARRVAVRAYDRSAGLAKA